jgi:glyoxylase-like metal-dependent hydrolase (beta-lactamase superfamily II)/fucose 4-O-acetylase-like acetyltransferase
MFALLVLLLAAPPAGLADGQEWKTVEGDAFVFTEVRDGIWHAVGGQGVAAGSNGAVIVSQQDVMVVDSHMTPSAARALLADLPRITDKPVRYLVNTHFHFDHTHGNEAFGPDVEIVAHEFTRYKVASGDTKRGRGYEGFIGSTPQRIEQAKTQLEGMSAEERAAAEQRMAAAMRVYEESEAVVPRAPTLALRQAVTLYRGEREIRLLHVGRGHTAGDIFVYLPVEKVLISGDFLTAGLPYMGDAFHQGRGGRAPAALPDRPLATGGEAVRRRHVGGRGRRRHRPHRSCGAVSPDRRPRRRPPRGGSAVGAVRRGLRAAGAMTGDRSSSETQPATGRGVWARALEMARRTPPERNRYVDFLRAVSICAVVFGHWLMATAHRTEQGLEISSVLAIQPPTQWLSWLFQVMPIFFVVGGFSNGVSWSSAVKRGRPYAEWLGGRMQRLVGPMVPLMLFWGVVSGVALALGESVRVIRNGTQMALIPLWFLAVYVFVAALTPVTHRLWRRFGIGSILGLAGAAVAVDLLVFAGGLEVVGWTNYLFVWLTVHQLGYAWGDRVLPGAAGRLALAVLGLAALVWMTRFGPYPLSLVGVPGQAISNTTPPKLPLLALALFQGGVLLALERPLRRWLEGQRPWAATIVVNGMIMTGYLWHLTPAVLLLGVGFWTGWGFQTPPGTPMWWAVRAIWIPTLLLALLPFLTIFNRFERPVGGGASTLPVARLIVGALLVTAGLAHLALDGVHLLGWDNPRSWALALPLAGAWLVGAWPRLGGRPPSDATKRGS